MTDSTQTPRMREDYIADMEDTLTQLANIVGIPRDADLLIQRVRELAALKRDGERYRWLREHWFSFGTLANNFVLPGCHLHAVAQAADRESLDAAIDAALPPAPQDDAALSAEDRHD